MTGVLLLIAALGASPVPEAASVATLEAHVTPPGPKRLDGYVRWYWIEGGDPAVIGGVWLSGRVAETFAGAGGPHVRLIGAAAAPRVMDGGCGVVHVRSRAPFTAVEARCGGR